MASTGTTRVRRLSSIDASRSDLYNGPIVVDPAENFEETCDADSTAIGLERAKRSLDETASDSGISEVEAEHPDLGITDKFAIAFDIDGVLVKGGNPLPAASDAMRYINGKNPYGVKM